MPHIAGQPVGNACHPCHRASIPTAPYHPYDSIQGKREAPTVITAGVKHTPVLLHATMVGTSKSKALKNRRAEGAVVAVRKGPMMCQEKQSKEVIEKRRSPSKRAAHVAPMLRRLQQFHTRKMALAMVQEEEGNVTLLELATKSLLHTVHTMVTARAERVAMQRSSDA